MITGPPPDVGLTDQTGLPPSVESLIPQAYSLKDWVPLNSLKEYIYPRKSPLESLKQTADGCGQTEILRGWLSEDETQELLAIMEEDDSSLHGRNTHSICS